MEEANKIDIQDNKMEIQTDTQNTFYEKPSIMQQPIQIIEQSEIIEDKNNRSQDILSDSPIYEPEDEMEEELKLEEVSLDADNNREKNIDISGNIELAVVTKRKLTEEPDGDNPKILKLEVSMDNTPNLDQEVSDIISAATKNTSETPFSSTSRLRTPVRSTPRKITKRSNSNVDITSPKSPKAPKARPASADILKSRFLHKNRENRKTFKTFEQSDMLDLVHTTDNSHSRPSVEFVKEIRPAFEVHETIVDEETTTQVTDSQNFHLVLSPVTEINDQDEEKNKQIVSISEPTFIKDRDEIIDPGKIHKPHSEGYNYSDQSNNLSQAVTSNYKEQVTDLESTDTASSIQLDSPENVPSMASKMISKLSNGNSSTPTDIVDQKPVTIIISDNENDGTPDMAKVTNKKGKRNHDSFRLSNNTTPSTISPLPNGHTMPSNTPQVPTFDIHLCNNEDGEFLLMYIVRTDSDIGVDTYKEFQRFSKRFTMDPYLADVSSSTSPSSVTSVGMVNMPNRTSFASTSSSTTTSNRTCDGAFVVPQPPRKSVTNPGSYTVKGFDALTKKFLDLFSHVRDTPINDSNQSNTETKVSIGIQASPTNANDNAMSNGNASPEEVGKCDKVTPKSSLKKTRVRGRRPLTGKTKRAILPTQTEEPEYMQGVDSPEMAAMNGENKDSIMKSPSKEEKLQSITGTPKSVNKLKQKKSRPTSPRPPTPVEKGVLKTDFPGYPPDTLVLAKWVDKRYYSGKVLELIETNKYLIKFDDSRTKILLDDFIIFGNMKTLPLQGQSVYALVDDEENYEPGLVLGIEENSSGAIIYRCTTDGDTTVCVTGSELYLTEDQARAIKETVRPKSPSSAPSTPRRRGLRELDLDNIIQGPRSARSRDKSSNSSAKKRIASPKSPKASTSGLKTKGTVGRKRLASESSELSESSNSAPPVRLEEVVGVEPEVQRTPRKIDGVKAGPLQIKGSAKRTVGSTSKKNSKLAKFENDADTVSILGPIPPSGSQLFEGMHFLLTCADMPRKSSAGPKTEKQMESRHYSSEEDGETSSAAAATDCEDLVFSDRPFNKERLREQLEAGGGIVYSHFDDVPKNKYSVCKLIAPRPCVTTKYIQCLVADIRALSHPWVIMCCSRNELVDSDSYVLPAGFSILKERYVNWVPPSGKRNTTFFKDKLILFNGDPEIFIKFWDRLCTLAGANTRTVNEEELNISGALALVTDWECPHELQNKANQENIPLVSTTWLSQCIIEGRILSPTSHDKFSFMYTEPE